MLKLFIKQLISAIWGLGIGDWGLGIGDWGVGGGGVGGGYG